MVFDTIEARNKFVETNINLVRSCVLRLNNNTMDDDLFQTGVLALITAVDRFDESKGFKFATFAYPYITGYIMKYKNFNQVIRPVRRKNEKGQFTYAQTISISTPITDMQGSISDILIDANDMASTVVEVLTAESFVKTLTVKERYVFNCLLANFKEVEIAEHLQCSRQYVNNMKKSIRTKYNTYIREDNHT